MADHKTTGTVYFHNMAGLNEWQRKYYSKIIVAHKLETIEGNTTGYLIRFCLNLKHVDKNTSILTQIHGIIADAKTIDYYHSGINTVDLI
ncbi:hypothetical protein [Lactobacillus paragasseri]|uniref:hypothetical protein n=1 Tax=Lactobacillus paragasseri TaxID=2107999 RepID=UPI00217F0CBB|nr:hypothetical protein [Lactobacillus paragasseri]UWI43865.1 hypothetical protein HR119_06585 [Lactobacillus paragasseri]UWI45109.1 hypothetical protein HR117_03865 [Lactobacillus paragasseri]